MFKLKVMVEYAVSSQPSQKISFLTYVDSPLEKIRRDVPYEYEGKSTKRILLSAAANEHESFQLIVVPMENLTNLAVVLNKYEDTLVLIEGHTDSSGSEEHNLGLSRSRAQSVARSRRGRRSPAARRRAR